MSATLHSLIEKDGFRPRGTEMTRVDAFSDVVFGFALTLLVVSLEVPKTYAELHEMLKGFIPFAICFTFLIMVWLDHYRFFLRYGLHDATTIRLNSVLLFVVLFYVYPLKFLFAMATGQMLGMNRVSPFTDALQIRELMVVYGVGFAAIYGLIALLNYQGLRYRNQLKLSPLEVVLTRSYVVDSGIVAGIGLLSCAVAIVLPPRESGLAGLTYLLIAVHKRIHKWRFGRKTRPLRAAPHASESADRIGLNHP